MLFRFVSFALVIFVCAVAAFAAPAGQVIDPLKLNANTLRRLEQKKRLQAQAIAKSAALHQFRFQDDYEASGIRFRHRAVDDAAKNWKPAHYDHGSGMAVADVDGDGRHDIYFANQLGSNSLYRNFGNGKFEDITARAGLAMDGKISVAAGFGDI